MESFGFTRDDHWTLNNPHLLSLLEFKQK